MRAPRDTRGRGRRATQTINIELPDGLYRRLEGMATVTRWPLQEILVQTIRGNLPLAPLSDEALWAVAKEPPPATDWRRHQRLLRKAEDGALTPVERRDLETLREATDRFVARRSVALALLKWRGHAIPTAP